MSPSSALSLCTHSICCDCVQCYDTLPEWSRSFFYPWRSGEKAPYWRKWNVLCLPNLLQIMDTIIIITVFFVFVFFCKRCCSVFYVFLFLPCSKCFPFTKLQYKSSFQWSDTCLSLVIYYSCLLLLLPKLAYHCAIYTLSWKVNRGTEKVRGVWWWFNLWFAVWKYG